jgi:cell wall-associated NlpC family hydrolase
MHRAPYPSEPQFGWIPPQDVAPQGVNDTLSTSISNGEDAQEPPVWVDTATVHYQDDRSIYWTPFSSDLPPTIIRPRRRATRVHVGSRVKYPMMVALTVAAISSGSLLSSGTAPAQAAPADDETTGSFRAIDPSQSEFDVIGSPVAEASQGVGGGSTSYTVVAGDTVRDIAASFGLSSTAVIEANNLANPDLIHPGDQLIIPGGGGEASSEITVVVEPGDSVGRLAVRYGVSSRAIIDHPGNDLPNPDLIYPGQELTIPGGVAPESGEPVAQTQAATNPEPVAETTSAPSNPEPVQAAAPQNITGQQIVDYAMSYLGYPYVWGAVGPNSFDCSGFTYYILNQLGINVARDMASQARVGVAVSRDELQPGDIVFQQNTYKAGMSHVGIYIGDGKFINAASPSVGVVISDLWDSYWGPRYHSARRIG